MMDCRKHGTTLRERGWVAVVFLLLVAVLAGCLDGDRQGAKAEDDPVGDDWFTDVEWDKTGPFSRTLEPGPYDVLPVERHMIKTHDGIEIASAVWRPAVAESEKVPVILDIGPYYAEIDHMDEEGHEHVFFIENFVAHGYAYGRVATRGTSESGGCMEYFGPDELKDVDTALDYYGGQSWSNGRIALYGASYNGAAAWMGSATGNEHLATIIPLSGFADAGEHLFQNGTAKTQGAYMHAAYWAFASGGALHILQPDPHPPVWRAGHLEDSVCPELAMGAVEGPLAALTGDLDRDYWKIRDFRERVLENYDGSVFLVHGMQDWTVQPSMAFPFMRNVEEKGLDVKIMLGQWGHDWPDRAGRQQSNDPFDWSMVRWDWAELLLRWLDRELKGHDVETGPTVDIQDSQGDWRVEETWPPSDQDWSKFHLGEGTLTTGPSPTGSSMGLNTGIGGLGLFEESTVLIENAWIFETEPFSEKLRFAGLPRLHATFTTTVPDANLHARLDSVSPTGEYTRVAWGVMNIRYHEGGSEPVVVMPGDPFVAKLEMFPVDAVIPKDHILRLTVHPNTQWDPAPRGPVPLELHWGDGQSVLKLPVIERNVGTGSYPGQP